MNSGKKKPGSDESGRGIGRRCARRWRPGRTRFISGCGIFWRGLRLAFSTLEELPEAIKLLHSRGVRGYLTFNTLVFEHELGAAAQAISAAARAGGDARIVPAVGILRLVTGRSRLNWNCMRVRR